MVKLRLIWLKNFRREIMKKFLSILLVAMMLIGVCACGSSETDDTPDYKIGITQVQFHRAMKNMQQLRK